MVPCRRAAVAPGPSAVHEHRPPPPAAEPGALAAATTPQEPPAPPVKRTPPKEQLLAPRPNGRRAPPLPPRLRAAGGAAMRHSPADTAGHPTNKHTHFCAPVSIRFAQGALLCRPRQRGLDGAAGLGRRRQEEEEEAGGRLCGCLRPGGKHAYAALLARALSAECRAHVLPHRRLPPAGRHHASPSPRSPYCPTCASRLVHARPQASAELEVYPEQGPIRLLDAQNLVLWVLGEGSNPRWCFIKARRQLPGWRGVEGQRGRGVTSSGAAGCGARQGPRLGAPDRCDTPCSGRMPAACPCACSPCPPAPQNKPLVKRVMLLAAHGLDTELWESAAARAALPTWRRCLGEPIELQARNATLAPGGYCGVARSRRRLLGCHCCACWPWLAAVCMRVHTDRCRGQGGGMHLLLKPHPMHRTVQAPPLTAC